MLREQVTCGRQQNTGHHPLLARSEALRGTIFRFRSTDAELDARSNSVPVGSLALLLKAQA